MIERVGEQSGSREKILLAGGSPDNLQVLMNTLASLGYPISPARTNQGALKKARTEKPTLILLDVTTSDFDGFGVCRQLKADERTANIAVIFCSALDDASARMQGFEVGGADFISKPFQTAEVVARVRTQLALARAHRELAERNERLRRELQVAQEFRKEALRRLALPLVGESPAMQAMRDNLTRVAKSNEAVLIMAASDSGAEAAARAIHDASPRSDGPFVAVDCALLHPNAETAVLRPGSPEMGLADTKLGMSRGGTLFLSAVDRLGPSMQEQLLELLQRQDEAEGQEAVGQEAVGRSEDTRLVVSVSPDDGGAFPSGYDQLLVQLLRRQVIRFPALTERREDIPDLVNQLVESSCRRLGRTILSVPPETMKKLQGYSWPGNLEELEEVVTRSVRSSRGESLQVDLRLLGGGIPLGDYRLIRKIGSGGMGEVWEATHHLLARPTAIKMIKPNSEDPEAREQQLRRFEREAKVTASLRSRNTIELYDFGVIPNGSFYYVMEKLEGMDLEQVVNKFGPFAAERVAFILHQATSSLGEAHGMGLVHRDIKPGNLFLCKLGIECDVLKVLDFGMVADPGSSEQTRLTKETSLCGTPPFMSPEAATGTRELTEKTDLYSLGCVGYWLLTGQHLFEAPSPMSMLLRHISEPPPPPSDRGDFGIPKEFEQLIMRCLEKKPEDRPSAMELRGCLEELPLLKAWTPKKSASWWEQHMAQQNAGKSSEEWSEVRNSTSPTVVAKVH